MSKSKLRCLLTIVSAIVCLVAIPLQSQAATKVKIISAWLEILIFQKLGNLLGMLFVALFLSACVSTMLSDATNKAKPTPLQSALGSFGMTPDMKKVKLLVESGVDVNEVNMSGSALGIASLGATPKVLDYLITHGANVNLKDQQGMTPLMWAAKAGRFDNVQLLIKKGADVNAVQSLTNFSPLSEAAYSGSYEMVKYLISKGADVSTQSGTTYNEAASGMGLHLKDDLNVKGKVITKDAQKAFEYIAILDLLKSKGANVNFIDSTGQTALHKAAQAGNAKVTRYFLKAGVNPDLGASSTPLELAQYLKDGFEKNKSFAGNKLFAGEIDGFNNVIAILTPVTNNSRLKNVGNQLKESLVDCLKLTAAEAACELLPVQKPVVQGCKLIAKSEFGDSMCKG